MWTVIKFTDEDDEEGDFDVIPTQWIINENQCLFPSGNLAHITSLVRNNAAAHTNWGKESISIIEKDIDNYEKASRMMYRASKKQSLISDDEKGRGLRQKKPSRFALENEEEVLEKENMGRKKSEKLKPKKSNTDHSMEYPELPSAFERQDQSVAPLCSGSNAIQSHNQYTRTCKIKAKHNCTFGEEDDFLLAISHQLCKLSADILKMKTNIKYIKEDVEVVGERHATNAEEAIAFEEEPFTLPVKTEEELNTFERELTNPMNAKKLIKFLVHLAMGKSVAQTVGVIMHRTISNELASTYSWKGQKKKSAFQEKELAKVIVASVATKYPKEPKQEIIKSIQLWLAQSTSRLKRAQQAAEKAREEI